MKKLFLGILLVTTLPSVASCINCRNHKLADGEMVLENKTGQTLIVELADADEKVITSQTVRPKTNFFYQAKDITKPYLLSMKYSGQTLEDVAQGRITMEDLKTKSLLDEQSIYLIYPDTTKNPRSYLYGSIHLFKPSKDIIKKSKNDDKRIFEQLSQMKEDLKDNAYGIPALYLNKYPGNFKLYQDIIWSYGKDDKLRGKGHSTSE